uniref:Uncharacterized protein n=1 Tax=Oryza brachyantha TaxID=4533 RepID=J3KUJ5_ORYBR
MAQREGEEETEVGWYGHSPAVAKCWRVGEGEAPVVTRLRGIEQRLATGSDTARAQWREEAAARGGFERGKVAVTAGYKWVDQLARVGSVAHPERYTLVLAPVIKRVKLKLVLIDGESALNILFAKMLDDMKIPRSKLCPSNGPFCRVIPGLSVTFSRKDNYRTENISFEVTDFETTYHAIFGFGRPALEKFIGILNYTYHIVKMSGPHRVITLCSDIKQAFSCEIAEHAEEQAG